MTGEINGIAQNEKDSGFETFLCEAIEMEGTSAKNNILPERNAVPEDNFTANAAKPKETNNNFIYKNGDCEKACLSDDSSAYDFSVDSGEDMECQGDDNTTAVNQEIISLSQADTVSFHSEVQSKLSQEF